MFPAKQDTDKKINCNFCSNKYAHKGSLTTHIKSKHKEDTETLKIYDMTKAIVEDVCNDVMTIGNTPKNILIVTHEDMGEMLDDIQENIDIAESLEAHNDLIKNLTCDICSKTMEYEEEIEEHKKVQHGSKKEVAGMNTTCKSCENTELVNHIKDNIIKRKNECIDQLGIKFRKMSREKRTLMMKVKSSTIDMQINEVTNGVEKDITKENKYKCKQCPFKTDIIGLIGRHILQKHRNQHKCPTCDKTFLFKEPLKRHMKRNHEIIIIGKKDGSAVHPRACAECKIKDEVLTHKEEELDKKEKHIKNLTPKNNELKKCKEEVDLARKTIAENVKNMNLLIIERDTLKARVEIIENTEQEVQEAIEENIEIPEYLYNKCKKCMFNTKNIEELRKHMEDKHKAGMACPSCKK